MPDIQSRQDTSPDTLGLTKLGIRDFRNLKSVDIAPSRHLNLIFGENASGKTSLLEAIYMLGRGKSFRSRQIKSVIRTESPSLSVFGLLEQEQGREIPIGLERSSSDLKIKAAGQTLKSFSEIAALLPIQIIQPNSHKLLEDGPSHRRSYLDWGVFHVEQPFYSAWKRYQKGLKQRNAALRARQGKRAVTAWDQELMETASVIHDCRSRYIELLMQHLPNYIEPIMGQQRLEIHYQPGWSDRTPYGETLEARLNQDIELGYTQAGPHRADLHFKVEGVNAVDRVSRGQQKVLVASCLLAQAGLYSEISGKRCVFLVDDLAAELDPGHRQRLMNVITDMNIQLFITSIEAEKMASDIPKDDIKVFHVEHGNIKEMIQ